MGIRLVSKGNWDSTKRLLKKRDLKFIDSILNDYGAAGVSALSAETPYDTGKTATSWTYEVTHEQGKSILTWSNTNVVNHVNIAVILQYGHASKNGSWVEGRDYINPALQPIFDAIADLAWKEVTK